MILLKDESSSKNNDFQLNYSLVSVYQIDIVNEL